MRQGRNVIIGYLLPLAVILGVISFLDTRRLLPAFGMMVVVTVATYFAYRWKTRNITSRTGETWKRCVKN